MRRGSSLPERFLSACNRKRLIPSHLGRNQPLFCQKAPQNPQTPPQSGGVCEKRKENERKRTIDRNDFSPVIVPGQRPEREKRRQRRGCSPLLVCMIAGSAVEMVAKLCTGFEIFVKASAAEGKRRRNAVIHRCCCRLRSSAAAAVCFSGGCRVICESSGEAFRTGAPAPPAWRGGHSFQPAGTAARPPQRRWRSWQ